MSTKKQVVISKLENALSLLGALSGDKVFITCDDYQVIVDPLMPVNTVVGIQRNACYLTMFSGAENNPEDIVLLGVCKHWTGLE